MEYFNWGELGFTSSTALILIFLVRSYNPYIVNTYLLLFRFTQMTVEQNTLKKNIISYI